jgi:STE24 endopeptidase
MGEVGGYRVRVPVDLRQHEAVGYRRAARRRGRLASAVAIGVAIAYAAVADDLPASGALIAALGILILQLAGLPFGLAGHRAARRHGLSVQSTAGWLADRAKGGAIALVLAAGAGAAVVAAQRQWPDGWPFAVWAGQLAVIALATVVVPVLVLPLFLRTAPLGDGELRSMAEELVRRTGVHISDIRLLVLSAKTTAANAAVVGAGPTRRILLGDTLVGDPGDEERLDETRAVLAHELGHQAHRDIARLFAAGAISAAVAWALAPPLAAALPAWLLHGGAGHASGLPALALAYGAITYLLAFGDAAHSRDREREADRYACRMAGGESFARAMERLVAANLAELEPPRYERLRASHPPPADRIAAARAVKESPA